MFRSIVVPIDGSAPSEAAVALAAVVATGEGSSITLVHAVDPARIAAVAAPSSIDPSVAISAAEEAGREILTSAAAKIEKTGVRVTTQLVEGDPVNAVLEQADQLHADLIVVGSHGRGGITRALLGSVAEGILRKSAIPVLVTHAPRQGNAA